METIAYIFYHKGSAQQFETEVYNNLLDSLPFLLQQQVGRYKKWEDRQRSLVGKNLLLSGLRSLNLSFCSLDQLRYNEFQKPYFDNEFDFNISHAHDITVCAISKTIGVGIDIERIKPIQLSDFTLLFSQIELQQIRDAEDTHAVFFSLWTQKESFAKAIGKGLHIPLKQIKIENGQIWHDNRNWFLQKVDIHPEYRCHLCLPSVLHAVMIQEITF